MAEAYELTTDRAGDSTVNAVGLTMRHRDRLVEAVAPTIDHYLTGDRGGDATPPPPPATPRTTVR